MPPTARRLRVAKIGTSARPVGSLRLHITSISRTSERGRECPLMARCRRRPRQPEGLMRRRPKPPGRPPADRPATTPRTLRGAQPAALCATRTILEKPLSRTRKSVSFERQSTSPQLTSRRIRSMATRAPAGAPQNAPVSPARAPGGVPGAVQSAAGFGPQWAGRHPCPVTRCPSLNQSPGGCLSGSYRPPPWPTEES
jgi:hypothetical protein